ncbi:Fatty acid synthase [Halotydeus destructor]|nr:Fatty acid synthase [Halotydeus destructor]
MPLVGSVDVVISGIAGRFPASDSVEEFRDNLYNGVDMVTADDTRWPVGLWGLPPCSGKVKSFDKFDNRFFGFTPKEVEYIDPQERKLLETTFEAIVDAGVDPDSLRGSNTGVFQGSCFTEFHKDFKDAAATSKYLPNQVTGISKFFNLKGPLMHVDTACGSSFCALNEAFRALKNGMCEQAIVTGSNTVFQPIFSFEMLDLHMISKDGKSKCMDSSANGYARAEAVVVIFLQKKPHAKRIYATILNAKTNADGWKPEGVTFPGQDGQAKLLRETYKEIGLDPLDFSYIEAHTTGTTAGDPVELNAIHDVLCEGRTNSLLVGCIKSCIGHSEGASGLCALIKSLLILQNKLIPPNLHLKNPNLNIKD